MEFSNFLQLLKERASCRSYLDRDVPDSMIDNCVEAARLSPSACNKQAARFIIVKDKEKLRHICEKCLLPGIAMPWLVKAPVIVLLYAEKNFLTHRVAPMLSGIPYHYIDAGIAGEHFVLAAEAQGLASCWIGWFNQKKIKELLHIPKKIELISLISLGYPAEKKSSPEKLPLEKICSREKFPITILI
jgi:nitroreductase